EDVLDAADRQAQQLLADEDGDVVERVLEAGTAVIARKALCGHAARLCPARHSASSAIRARRSNLVTTSLMRTCAAARCSSGVGSVDSPMIRRPACLGSARNWLASARAASGSRSRSRTI